MLPDPALQHCPRPRSPRCRLPLETWRKRAPWPHCLPTGHLWFRARNARGRVKPESARLQTLASECEQGIAKAECPLSSQIFVRMPNLPPGSMRNGHRLPRYRERTLRKRARICRRGCPPARASPSPMSPASSMCRRPWTRCTLPRKQGRRRLLLIEIAGMSCGIPVSNSGPQQLRQRNCTGVPISTRSDNLSASQLVSRTHPCEFAYPIVSGDDVPWIP